MIPFFGAQTLGFSGPNTIIPKSDMPQGWELWGALQRTSLHRNFLEVDV